VAATLPRSARASAARALAWLACALALTLAPGILRAQDTTSSVTAEFQRLLDRLRTASFQQDSLSALADSSTGELRTVRDEQLWERQAEVDVSLLAIAAHLRQQQSAGLELTEERRILNETVQRGWPRYRELLRRNERQFDALRVERDAASGAQRVALESRISELAERQASHVRSLVDGILSLDGVGVDVSEPRRYVTEQLSGLADVLVTRLRVIERDRESAAAQVARAPSDQGLRQDLLAIEERRNRVSDNLDLAIELMGRLGLETTRYQVLLITSTGKITSDIIDLKVVGGLLQHARRQFLNTVATQAPRWLSHALVILLIFFGFRLLARLTRAAVRRAVERSTLSHLVRDTLIAGSSKIIMTIGLIVILTQLGVHVGALVAGLGIAGFVIGFAMQNTLANFAAGGMILAYRPYDLGDSIEAAGVSGTVKTMSLVATTILTADNQTLIVPNSKIWGDVIRNITAQAVRRVDLTFGVSYTDDLEKAERVLNEIVKSHPQVLADPPPVIKLHQLVDGSVNFIARPWTRTEHYWEVYWDITKTVKERFDQEAISIPFARRDLYLHMSGAPPTGGPADGASPGAGG
jgi:small conductance mechanosensitive channel